MTHVDFVIYVYAAQSEHLTHNSMEMETCTKGMCIASSFFPKLLVFENISSIASRCLTVRGVNNSMLNFQRKLTIFLPNDYINLCKKIRVAPEF